ncbi:SGNH/GDSL hydrolase family protein [Patescibacteria group bacterium]|nr:SGNH/GDSL hydrolase family protein [Patescibacteria group bacterium]
MKKFLKFFLILTTFLLSTTATYKIAHLLSERCFFDKLYYKKSPEYGYFLHNTNPLLSKNSKIIESRIADLKLLTAINENSHNNRIKGITNNESFQIAIIGDSFVYGTGVKQADRYANRLEKLLNQIKPTKIYVLALPGDNILEHYTKFKLAQENIKPDLYIIGIANNDLLINDFIYPNQEFLYQKSREECFLPEFKYNWPDYAITIDQLILTAYYPSFDDQYANICYLKKIIKEIATTNTLFFNFYKIENTNSTQDLSEAEQKDIQIMKKYTEIIQLAGGQIFHLHNSRVSGEYQPVSFLEGHPSKETHEWFAKALFNRIIINNNLGFTHD